VHVSATLVAILMEVFTNGSEGLADLTNINTFHVDGDIPNNSHMQYLNLAQTDVYILYFNINFKPYILKLTILHLYWFLKFFNMSSVNTFRMATVEWKRVHVGGLRYL